MKKVFSFLFAMVLSSVPLSVAADTMTISPVALEQNNKVISVEPVYPLDKPAFCTVRVHMPSDERSVKVIFSQNSEEREDLVMYRQVCEHDETYEFQLEGGDYDWRIEGDSLQSGGGQSWSLPIVIPDSEIEIPYDIYREVIDPTASADANVKINVKEYVFDLYVHYEVGKDLLHDWVSESSYDAEKQILYCHTNLIFYLYDGMRGDLNADGKISEMDAVTALQLYANSLASGKNMASKQQCAIADLDMDCKITSVDATVILRYYSYGLLGEQITWEDLL